LFDDFIAPIYGSVEIIALIPTDCFGILLWATPDRVFVWQIGNKTKLGFLAFKSVLITWFCSRLLDSNERPRSGIR